MLGSPYGSLPHVCFFLCLGVRFFVCLFVLLLFVCLLPKCLMLIPRTLITHQHYFEVLNQLNNRQKKSNETCSRVSALLA